MGYRTTQSYSDAKEDASKNPIRSIRKSQGRSVSADPSVSATNLHPAKAEFLNKSASFAKSGPCWRRLFQLTAKVGKLKGWDTTAINERQQELAKLAVAAWSIKLK
jgi:hypothetical protein